MLTDLRTSLRQLLRSPVFTGAALLTLTLAIAAATTIFSVYNGVVYRPAQAMDWTDVYLVSQLDGNGRFSRPEAPQIDALLAYRPPNLLAVAALSTLPVVLQHEQRAVKGYAELVDGDYATLYRVRPQAGRLLDARDEGIGSDSVVVSANLWREWFGARHTLTGRESIQINGQPFRIVGVMPRGLLNMWATEVWLPASVRARITTPEDMEKDKTRGWSTFVRARPGASSDEVRTAVADAVARAPSLKAEGGIRVYYWGRSFRPFGEIQVYGVTALLLLAACTNLTNLVYARLAQRRGDIAVRLALGSGRYRIIRAFLFEILTITGTAAVLGYATSVAVLSLLSRAFPAFRRDQWGLLADVAPDARVLLFCGAIAAVIAIVLSAVVTINVGRLTPARLLASTGVAVSPSGGGRRFRTVLVGVQVTVAVVLVMGAGLFLVSAWREIDRAATFSDVRYESARLGSLRLNLAYYGYHDAAAAAFHSSALDAVRRQPQIQNAALASGLPGASRQEGSGPTGMYVIADTGTRVLSGRPPQVQASYIAASPQFLRTIGLPVEKGRDFTPGDVEGAPLVLLISETLARMLFPHSDPIGQRLLFNDDRKPRMIVGVFRDPLVSQRERWMVAHNVLVLVPAAQYFRREMMIVVRSDRPTGAVEAAAAAVTALEPRVAVFDARAVEEALLAETAPIRAMSLALSAFGTLALVFAALGVYGVMSFFVSTRVREFGIRLALGATPGTVLRHVFAEARLLLLLGTLAGVLLSALTERLVDSRVVASMPNAIQTWFTTIALVLATGLIATYFPARRASQTDPMVALREL